MRTFMWWVLYAILLSFSDTCGIYAIDILNSVYTFRWKDFLILLLFSVVYNFLFNFFWKKKM